MVLETYPCGWSVIESFFRMRLINVPYYVCSVPISDLSQPASCQQVSENLRNDIDTPAGRLLCDSLAQLGCTRLDGPSRWNRRRNHFHASTCQLFDNTSPVADEWVTSDLEFIESKKTMSEDYGIFRRIYSKSDHFAVRWKYQMAYHNGLESSQSHPELYVPCRPKENPGCWRCCTFG
jgi:hypothetical protein